MTRRGPKVQLCHKTGNGSYHSIEVSINAEPAHRAHGDGKIFRGTPEKYSAPAAASTSGLAVAQWISERAPGWQGATTENTRTYLRSTPPDGMPRPKAAVQMTRTAASAHSPFNAMTGSVPSARRAGSHDATSTVPVMMTTIKPTTAGSPRSDVVEKRARNRGSGNRQQSARDQARADEYRHTSENRPQNIGDSGAEGQAYPNLALAAGGRVGHDPVEPDGSHDDRDDPEKSRQTGHEPFALR